MSAERMKTGERAPESGVTGSGPSSVPFQSGDIIANKYRVEKTLGSGAMGIVFEATHTGLETPVAIKVMHSNLAAYPDAVERVLREAKLMVQIHSRHVCQVTDVGTLETGTPYIVMELLKGHDLADLLAERQTFSIESAIDFIVAVCEAVAEAHAAKIVHRDLKPENLFIAEMPDGSRIIKVLDFGVSKWAAAPGRKRVLTGPEAAIGSRYYGAPEQMSRAKDADFRADIWALGAILFELLTSQTAFPPAESEALDVVDEEPLFATHVRPEIPQAVARAIHRCLQKNPAQRFDTVADLARALVPFGTHMSRQSMSRIERALKGDPNPSSGQPADPLKLNPDPTASQEWPVHPSVQPAGASARLAEALVPPAEPLVENGAGTNPFELEAELARIRPRRWPWLLLLVAGGAAAGGYFAWTELGGAHASAADHPATESPPPRTTAAKGVLPPAANEAAGSEVEADRAPAESESAAQTPPAQATAKASARRLPQAHRWAAPRQNAKSAAAAKSATESGEATGTEPSTAAPGESASATQSDRGESTLRAWDRESFGTRR